MAANTQYVAMTNIHKRYGSYEASRDINLDIEEGQIVALLGPSGSGKTTILRMLAGLETPDSGDIYIRGRRVNDVPPAQRGIGFVFQSYALFQHMTVFDNIAFGLTIQGASKQAITDRVTELLQLTSLGGLAARYPGELSGGQRQRVAFARALAPHPMVLLLDEPFAAIDAKVKQELRGWLKETIKKAGTTSVFVTHDQEEAVELADKIVVTNKGCVEQIGTPQEIYGEPLTPFVAGFMGKPDLLADYGQLKGFTQRPGMTWAVIRPEFVKVFKYGDADDDKSAAEDGIVESISFYGTYLTMKIRIGTLTIQAEQSIETNAFKVGEKVQVLIYRLFICDEKTVEIAKNKALEAGQVFYI